MYKKIALLLLLMVLILPVVGLDTGLTLTAKTAVDMKAGEVKFSDRDSSLSVSTTTLINNVQFVPAYETKEGKKVIWGTDEKYLIIFPDPVVKFTYENTDEKTLKETIILKEDKELAFVVNLDKNTRIIPWENGQWKIVSAVDTSDTMTGIVALKPFGIDANGNRIEMEYKWNKETNTLNLTYNREVLVLNEKLTEEGKPNEAGIKTPVYDKSPITYPLTIDPTWVKVDAYYRSYDGTDTILMFNATGANSWVAPVNVSNVWFTIVAGGGGGGGVIGGGGGAGGFINSSTTNITPGNTYYISVGTGGIAGTAAGAHAGDGGASIFSNISATGGGGGGDNGGAASYDGNAGGSSGGAVYTGVVGANVSGQGMKGGISNSLGFGLAGGGGGAAQNGENYTEGIVSGFGGDGKISLITGCTTYYAGGGSGGSFSKNNSGVAGLGGGGKGGTNTSGYSGIDGTGGGAGGGGYVIGTSYAGGTGGTGVVIIRYNTPMVFDKWEKNETGHWIMLNGSMVYHMFNETGNYSWNVPANTANANYIIVAGGGSGGGTASAGGGGGGGAGGFIADTNYPINGTINISVGAGGVGVATLTFNGSPSNLSMIQALGGGGGAPNGVGNPGGSGGGSAVSLSMGGVGIVGQGMGGGASTTSTKYGGGGGGGNLSLGTNGSTTTGGYGGRCNTTYLGIYKYNLSAGGGGGIYQGGTPGYDVYCAGTGGSGNVDNAAGYPAQQKTGSGGGGSGGRSLSFKGGDGGSGIIFVWYSNVSTTAPVSNFLISNYSGSSPLLVNFTDISTGSPTSWNWTFGVANFSNAQHPSYTFVGEGNYSITLNASSSSGFNNTTKYINVLPPKPAVNFTSNITSDYIPFTVQFNDTSENSPTGWAWFFGDEPYTNGWVRQNSSVWGANGRFGGLTITSNNGSILYIGGFDNAIRNETRISVDKGVKWANITGVPGWVARYYLTGGKFSDDSIIILGGYDGANSRNDTWLSTDNGTTWTLMNTSPGWTVRYGATSVVLPDDSVVLMGGYFGSGSTLYNDVWRSTNKGYTWTRQNASAGWVARYFASSVVMEDGSIVIMGGQNTAGVYRNDTWRSTDKGLTWTNITGSPGWTARTNSYVVRMPDNSIILMGGQDAAAPPWKNDTWRSTDNGTTWTLTNLTAGWLGRTAGGSTVLPDGSIMILGGRTSTTAGSGVSDAWRIQPAGSTEQNATHTYSTAGSYNVSLTAYNQYGWNTTIKTAYITALSMVADFTSNSTVGTMYPYVVQFNDTSSGIASTWNWSFGDGRWFNTTSSALKNATYTYAVAGKYDVALKINNSVLTNTTTKTQYINLTSDNDNNLTSWLHMNTSFNGEKGAAWTVSGTAQISNSIFKYGGGSGYFPPASPGKPYIYTPSSSAFNFSTGDFTIEMWVNSTNPETNDQIIHKGNNAQTNGWGLDNNNGSQNGWDFWMGNDTSGQTPFFTIPTNKWTHVVIERQSAIIYVYIDGNLTTTKSGMGGNYDTTSRVEMGYLSPNNYYEGYIDEFRITKGLARWNANFTPPYNQYAGTLETIYPDINPNSTMRYKTNPDGNASITNKTPRNRTIQIENVYNTSYVIGVATFDPDHFFVKAVRLNETYFPTGMVLISSNIDNTLGEISFNVSRPAGFNGGTDRASIVDYELLYYNYSQPDLIQDFFGSGYLLNGTTFKLYPVHNFISTNVTLLEWTITTNFTANTTTTLTGEPILFTDDSYLYDSYPTQWNWSFGDGTWDNGTNQTPTHSYSTPGLKSVSLQAGLWQNQSIYTILTKIDYINVYDYVQASFTSNTTSGLGVIPVQFNDTTLNITSAWNWSFNNITGNNTEVWFSTTQNATHVFGIGNWSIRLNASNLFDYNITPANTYFINVSTINPVVEFTANGTTIVQGTPVEFTDLSGINILSWSWDFGDGNTSNLQNPIKTYDVVGTHSVSLNVVNFSGSNSTTKINYIVVNPRIYPVANFNYNNSGGIQDVPVQFTSTSISNILTYEWDFGDGNASLTANPLHVYSVPGTYSVKLNVSNASGYNEITKPNIITITERVKPIPIFTGTPLVGQAPLSVAFTDISITGITAWSWDFGDGGTSILQNPSHTYNVIGSFDVSLTVQNASDVNTTTKLLYINTTNEHIYANFVVSPTSATTIPATITFTDTSTSTPGTVIDTWLWNFGDGSTSTLQNPTHVYTIAGLYTISLTASGSTLVPISDTKTNNNFLPISNNTPFVYPVQAAIDLPNYTSHGINYNFLYYLLVSNRTGPWEFPALGFAATLMAPFTEAFETIGGEGWGSGVYFILLGLFFLMVWRNSGSVRIPTLMAVIVSGGWAILLPESAYPWVLIIITACLASMLLQLFAQEGT